MVWWSCPLLSFIHRIFPVFFFLAEQPLFYFFLICLSMDVPPRHFNTVYVFWYCPSPGNWRKRHNHLLTFNFWNGTKQLLKIQNKQSSNLTWKRKCQVESGGGYLRWTDVNNWGNHNIFKIICNQTKFKIIYCHQIGVFTFQYDLWNFERGFLFSSTCKDRFLSLIDPSCLEVRNV